MREIIYMFNFWSSYFHHATIQTVNKQPKTLSAQVIIKHCWVFLSSHKASSMIKKKKKWVGPINTPY